MNCFLNRDRSDPPPHCPGEQCDGQYDSPEGPTSCNSAATRWYSLKDGYFLNRCDRHRLSVKRFNGRPVVEMSYDEAVVAFVLES